MIQRIASRKAAFSLVKIMCLMLLPIVLLGYLYNREAAKDIAFVDKEIKGLQLINFAAPLIFNSDASGLGPNQAQIMNLEKEVLLGQSPPSLLAISTGKPDKAQAQSLYRHDASSFITKVLTDSNLILDSDAETYHLIASVLQNLPRVFATKEDILRDLEQVVQARQRDSAETRKVMKTVGALEEAIIRLGNSFESARSASNDPAFYAASDEPLHHLSTHTETLVSLLMQSQGNTGEFAIRSFLAGEKRESHFKEDTLELWEMASQRIDQRLKKRLTDLRHQNILMTGIGLISSLLAIGIAIMMFRNTLVKLDQIESMHHAEAASRLALEEVNSNIASLNSELSTNMQRLELAQEELVKKGRMEQLGQLTATIAHELRNPLGSVRTSAFLMERKLKDKNLGVETQFDRINKGITRCDNIITQLLDYSRTKQLTAKSDNLDSWLVKTVEEAAKQLPEAVQIECVLGLDDQYVPFDASRLERAIVNLLNNASEAMVGQGTDPTKFACAQPTLTIKTSKAGEDVAIAVSDNGPGISIENLSKVREPLFTTKSFGTGLGIPAIEQIARQHGGRLEIASQPGLGAEFTIFIPIQPLKDAA
jgi:signal transduction histidine kinase